MTTQPGKPLVTPAPHSGGAGVPQDVALKLQLAMLAGDEPRASCFELRGLRNGRILRRTFIRVYGIRRAMSTIGSWSEDSDVFIGCAPRTSYTSGTLNDIERAWCLWCDCDSKESSDKLRDFRPAPSLVVASGGPDHHQGYWQLSAPLSVEAVDRANRRLKLALNSDSVCDATRVLRPIGSHNHKYGEPVPVRCVRLDPVAYTMQQVVGDLGDDQRYKPRPRVPVERRHRKSGTSGLVATVASAEEGNRNKTLYWAARRAADEGTLHQLHDELEDAAIASGLDERSAQATLTSAERAA